MGSGTDDSGVGQRRWPRGRGRHSTDVVAAVLAVVALLLVGLSLLTRYLAYRREVAAPGIAPPSWSALFDVNGEANVPTWFTVALMVTASTAAIGAGLVSLRAAPRSARFFLALAFVLLLLSLDEIAGLHERLGDFGADISRESALHFAWVVPGLLLAGVIVVALLVGGRSLLTDTRRHLLVATAMYFAGALGAEAVSGQVLVAQGDRAAYLLVTALEELLEMLGVILVLRAVLNAIRTEPTNDGWVLHPIVAARL